MIALFRPNPKVDSSEKDPLLDLAITSRDEDELRRADFASHLADYIRKINVSKGSVAVAIVGPWGNGKSSFINLIKEHITVKKPDSKHILIDFSPWSYSQGSDIARVFFERLIIATNPVDATLSKYLKQYLGALSAMDQTAYEVISGHFGRREKDLQRLHLRVHEELAKSRKTYIVVIDDIDRLERREIIEVLRIVRSSAGFPNIKFICAFDKNYVSKTLAQDSSAITDRYLEKFFQIEYWLPAYEEDTLRNLILRSASFLSDDEREQFRQYLFSERAASFARNENPLSNGINNIRMARRWIHAIEISYNRLRNEILIDDLADLELMKLIAPSFYEYFRTNWPILTETDGTKLKLYAPRDESTGSRNDDFIALLFRGAKSNIYETAAFLELSTEQGEHVKHILSRLLPEYGAGKDKAFSNSVYTERYFFHALRDSEISDVEFRELIAKPLPAIQERISAPDFLIKSKAFAIQIEKYVPQDITDTRKYIHTVFCAGRVLPGFMIDGMTFMENLYQYRKNDDIIKSHLKNAVTENRASEFSLKFFQIILRNCPEKYYTPFFNREIEYKLAEELLYFAIEDQLPFQSVSHFYWSTVKHEYDWTGGTRKEVPIHNDRAKLAYRDYWERNITDFHTKLYYKPHGVDADENYYQANEIAFILWGDKLDGLLDLLSKYGENPDVSETIRFLKAVLAAEDQRKAIPFEFRSRGCAR